MDSLAYSIIDAAKVLNLSKTTVYKLLNEGKLVARRYGGRSLIARADLEVFLQSLPLAEDLRKS